MGGGAWRERRRGLRAVGGGRLRHRPAQRSATTHCTSWSASTAKLPTTVECLTGGGGRHIYLRDPGCELRGELAPGVEIKRRAYVNAPPSCTTGAYVWACDQAPGEVELAAFRPAWLAAVRSAPRPAVSDARAAASSADDWLLTIPPPRYFAELAGVAPDLRGFVRCPIPRHEDRTPSCRVYSDPERGWFCFGCRRGGSIYELAAYLADERPPLRGVAFLRVQDALLSFYEDLLGVAA